MKCQKCGSEVPAGSKFCNECGAKIEQVALFKDSEPESTESYKCGECGKIIPNNSVFCPECHAYQKNKFKPTSDTEKSSDKKPIYRTSHFYIALLVILILCVTTVTAIVQVTQPYTQEEETTSNDNAVQNIAKNDSLKQYYIAPFSITVPEEWRHKSNDDYNYFYNSHGEMLYIYSSILETKTFDFSDEYIDGLMRGFAESFKNYKEISRTNTVIDGYSAYNITITMDSNDISCYGNAYVWVTKNYLCFMVFSSYGDKQSEEFNLYEDTILNSITVDSDEEISSTDEKSATEKDTEPETEPPTEKPTEFEDTLTELYSDNDIAVYYSDTEQYPYSDDEADVHFYVKNKMDKSITIQADTVILDGRSYNQVVCSNPISAHSEGMIEVSIDNCKNFNPSTVGADLRYFDTDSYENDVKMNLVSKKVK